MSEYDRAVARRVRADLLVTLQSRGRMSITDLLDLSPDNPDGDDIVFNSISELTEAGLIRKVMLPTGLGYEFAGQGTPSEQRRLALAFLAKQ